MKEQKNAIFKRLNVSAIILTAALVAVLASPLAFRWDKQLDYSSALASNSSLVATPYHEQVSKAIVRLVKSFHYSSRPLDNEFSEIILDGYLAALDSNRIYFRHSDIQNFRNDRLYIDDYLRKGRLDKVYDIFRIYQERVAERSAFAISMLDFKFDFELNDSLVLDRKHSDWSISQVEHDALWRRLVKNEVLKLRLSDTPDDEIKETLAQRYKRFSQFISLTNSDDVFEIFINSYLRAIEPHSEYFSPHNAENLRISITQKFEGIGAMLRSEDDFTVVHSVIPGGPAARSEKIQPGDRIVALSKDESSGFVEIVGWRLNDVVDQIRGQQGTAVSLKIMPKDALPDTAPRVVTLVRDKIKLEDQIAKKHTAEITADDRHLLIGIISMPAFYSNLLADSAGDDGADATSISKDVRRLLVELNEQGVDGVVVDLRNNGGGALSEAVGLTGLFVEDGPIVQVEKFNGEKETIIDEQPGIAYDGPLAVLVDRRSASASEIFAAAIKDYKRGIVVGETTFGKGLIQTVWPTNQLIRSSKIGNVKLTTAQYFRISGPSTQHVGVVPHIVFPTNEFIDETGERSLQNALPESWTEAADFDTWHKGTMLESQVAQLRHMHRKRIELNPVFSHLINVERLNVTQDDVKTVTLNEKRRAEEQMEFRDLMLTYVNDLRRSLGLPSVEKYDEESFPSERIGDAFLDETLNILADFIIIAEQSAKHAVESQSPGARSGTS